jgi:hypothetical protein
MDVGCLEHITECLSGAGSHVWWFVWYFSTISYPYIRKMCVTRGGTDHRGGVVCIICMKCDTR